jgi:hypothetical protein
MSQLTPSCPVGCALARNVACKHTTYKISTPHLMPHTSNLGTGGAA